MVIVADDLIVW